VLLTTGWPITGRPVSAGRPVIAGRPFTTGRRITTGRPVNDTGRPITPITTSRSISHHR